MLKTNPGWTRKPKNYPREKKKNRIRQNSDQYPISPYIIGTKRLQELKKRSLTVRFRNDSKSFCRLIRSKSSEISMFGLLSVGTMKTGGKNETWNATENSC